MKNKAFIKPFKRAVSFLILMNLLAGNLALFAQTRRSGATTSANQSKSASKCSGAWTGIVTYTRTQTMTSNKTVDRVSGRGKDTTNWEMKYKYTAKVAVTESPEKNGSSVGKATIDHDFSSIETVSAVEKNSCDRGKTWRDMTGESTSTSETSVKGGKEDANVSVGVNADGTYTVSVGVPPTKGETKGKQTSTYSGQCVPREGKTLTMQPTIVSVDGNSLTSDASNRINPADPNRISGSYSKTWENVTETITWNLQKCGAPLRLVDVEFEDMKFPNWNTWQKISEQKGTVDGNLIKIKAKILNASGETKFADVRFKETFKGDKWEGARPDGLLENGEVSVRLDPGEEREVEIAWDSSGYAWFDDGRPRLLQRIKAELVENGKQVDELTKNLKVAPKPVVLVHGLWSNWKAWESWQNILTTSHSFDWKAFPVGEKPEKGLMNTGDSFLSSSPTNGIFENSQQLGKYIRYAQEDRNAWHVDIVAHSMGGLISRHYIHQFMPADSPDGRPQISHLVMLGTPNMGSPCADVMNFAFEMVGKNVEAIKQLKPSFLEEFNRVNLNRKGVKFSVLAGNPLPIMCKDQVWNDGVVPVESAIWKIKDNSLSKSIHTELTGTKDFSDFVKPRLAIGPKGNHNPEAPELANYPNQTGEIGRSQMESLFINAGNNSQNGGLRDENYYKPSLARALKIAPNQSVEIEIPTEQAENLGITYMATPIISVSLINDKGAIVGKNLAKTPESYTWFRSIFVDKNVTPGTWKLKLENTSAEEREAVIAVWFNAKPKPPAINKEAVSE